MAVAVDQTLGLQELVNTANNDSANFSVAPAAGSTVVVPISVYGNITVTSVIDNQSGNTFTLVSEPYSGGQIGSYLAYCEGVNVTGTYTLTVNFSANAYARWAAISFTGAEVASTNSAEGLDAAPQVALTIPQNGCYAVAVCTDSTGIALTEPASWTRLAYNNNSGDIIPHSSVYRQVDTGTSTPIWSDGAQAWAVAGIVIEPSVVSERESILMSWALG